MTGLSFKPNYWTEPETDTERIISKERAAWQELADDDPRHGKYSTYVTYKCRCDACKRANADQALRRKYGISMNERDRMLEDQGWLCAACPRDLRELPTNHRHVDHDHKTGKIRGVLCHGCNVALGMLGDDPERIRGLLAYAERHQPGTPTGF